jgi:hypothetical protein
MYLVDTNVFLEVLLGQPKASECVAFLEAVRDARASAVVTDFTIHSVCVILERRGQRRFVSRWLDDVARFQGLTYVQASLGEQSQIARVALAEGLDFDDAYQYFFARLLGRTIVSFDRDFDGRAVPRLEPGAAIP